MNAAWFCQDCDDTGGGEQGEVDKAAEKHTKKTGHTTITSTVDLRAVNRRNGPTEQPAEEAS